ncbi:MAG: HAD family phosphatase [Prevotellaceae bacterium]|jgi:putative hydrolase of the HAD superfamily|nr:HAD family phosphatase [Prevotellaceae bacterium]
MKNLADIKNIVFDFGGVLINLDKQLCVDSFKRLGLENIDSMIGNYAQTGLFLQLERGEVSPSEFRDEIRRMIGKPVSDEEIDKAWHAFLLDIPQYKLDLLADLCKKYRVLLLSNTNIIHFEQARKSQFETGGRTMDNYFEKCYLSYEIGLTKPYPEVFEYLLADARILPHETLFIDDGEANIETARAMGFAVYLAKPEEDFKHLFA